jgi:hypothetical protein
MAPSDISLGRMAHHPQVPARTAAPIATQTTPTASAAASTAPSFTAIFAAMAAADAAAGTTAARPATGGSATLPTASTAPAVASPTPAAASTTPAAPSDSPAEPVFADNPWLADPTCSGPGPQTNYNPIYFATPQTAQTVAQMVGGTVVSMNAITSAPGSPFQQDQPNLMVQLPNGGLINPGLVADIYTHGWNQSFVDQQVANEVAGAIPAGTNT